MKELEVQGDQRRLSILYVGNFDENVSIGEPEIAKCLEEFGHQIIRLDEHSKDTTIQKIQQVIESQKCDLLLFAKFRINNNPHEIKAFLENLQIPKIAWCFDIYWGM